MSKRLTVLLVCVFFPGMVRAQDAVIKDFNDTHVEKFIKDEMKTNAQKNVLGDRILYATPDGFFDVESRGAAGKSVVFVYSYAKLKFTAEKLNEWNARDANCMRAFIDKKNAV